MAGGLNLYGYAGGDPINFHDPFGLCASDGEGADTTRVAECTYSQSSGDMSCTETKMWDGGSSVETMTTKGYSGAPGFVNDATAQNRVGQGPIPLGTYRVTPGEERHKRLGDFTMMLTPENGTNVFGRSGFLWHADNRRQDQSASQGCIVTDRASREWAASRNVSTVRVVK